jgi:hypothetical protein
MGPASSRATTITIIRTNRLMARSAERRFALEQGRPYQEKNVFSSSTRHSLRKASIGSTRVARRAGK